MENKIALAYLKDLIDYYKHRKVDLHNLVDCSYTAFLEYVKVTEYLTQLKLLYYKLTAKEYEE